MKKIISIILTISLIAAPAAALADNLEDEIRRYPWAETAARYCFENGILSGDEYGDLNLGGNITRAQMARIFTDAYGLEASGYSVFADSKVTDWYYPYSLAIQKYMPVRGDNFNGGDYVSREEFAATLVKASGMEAASSYSVTRGSFSDSNEVDDAYKNLVETAVKNLYMRGDGTGLLHPQDLLTRAEACSILYHALNPEDGLTTIFGESEVTVEQAARWATACGGTEAYVNAAPIYWQYGEILGIRPDVMYAQAGKETGYGKYGGAVLPEMNNWAGIKIKNPQGDATEDHEAFETQEDGIRAHFNHMCAYVGLEPVGEVHDRYYVVLTTEWAGRIAYVEQLGGRWCPDINYGYNIIKMLSEMQKY